MDTSNMKNIVVLKNLPSNLVEEAIVFLKPNKKIKKPEYVDKKFDKSNLSNTQKSKPNENYVVKEAEMVIANYLSNIENQKIKNDSVGIKMQEKYKKLQKLTVILGLLFFMSTIIILMK